MCDNYFKFKRFKGVFGLRSMVEIARNAVWRSWCTNDSRKGTRCDVGVIVYWSIRYLLAIVL